MNHHITVEGDKINRGTFASVHGAIECGIHAAREVIAALRN